MNGIKFTDHKAIGFYLDAIGAVGAFVSFVFYILYGNSTGERNLLIILPLILVIALTVLFLFYDNDWTSMVSAVLVVIAFCAFLTDSVYTFVGYVFNLAMFGDVSMMGSIVKICVCMTISLLCIIASCFMDGRKTG